MSEYEKIKDEFEKPPSVSWDTLNLITDVIGRAKALRKAKSIPCSVNRTFYMDNKPYRIVMLSMPIRIKAIDGSWIPPHVPHEHDVEEKEFKLVQKEFDHFTVCVRDPSEDIKYISQWCDHLKAECTRLLLDPPDGENGIKFLVINELGFPNFWLGRLVGLSTDQLRHELMQINMALHARLQDLADKKNVVILAGTSHDATTFQNFGPIFFPERIHSTDHKKLTSAYKIGEYIRPQVGQEYPVYSMGPMTFSVLICSDAFDLNIFFEQFAAGTMISKLVPNVVFVPSFYVNKPGRTNAILNACRQLSLATNVIVVFCNHLFDSSRHAVFLGGQELRLKKLDIAASEVNIDAIELASIRAKATPVWEEMNQIFRVRRSEWRDDRSARPA